MRKISKLVKVSCVLAVMTATLLVNGCSKEEDKAISETVVLTVDDSKVYLDEMMYHVMLAQMQGQLYASLVKEGENYWDIVNEDGKTMKEATKDVAMDNAIKYELLYQLAVNEGYILTDEEITQCQEKTDNIMKNVPAETLSENELTKEEIIAIQEKIALSTRYYNNLLIELNIDETAIRESIDSKQFQQYDIQYIFAQKQDYDALEGILESAKTTDDITTLATDSKFNTGYATFLKGENYFGDETNLEEAILGMQKGEVSDLIETSKGYYIIKLKDNTSTSKYDDAVKAELEKEVEELFTPKYEAIKKEHKITIANKAWDKVEIDTEAEKQ